MIDKQDNNMEKNNTNRIKKFSKNNPQKHRYFYNFTDFSRYWHSNNSDKNDTNDSISVESKYTKSAAHNKAKYVDSNGNESFEEEN